MKIDELIRELEAVVRNEQTTAANVGTVAVPLGGVAPGAGGGSIKPWGNWDDKKSKEKQFKKFNRQLAKGKLPQRESVGDGWELDVDKNHSSYDLFAMLISPDGQVMAEMGLSTGDIEVEGKRLAFISDLANVSGEKGMGRKLVAKTVNWLLKHGMILASGEGSVDRKTGKIVSKHSRTPPADRMHAELAASSGSKLVDVDMGDDGPHSLQRLRVYPKPMAESVDAESAAMRRHQESAACESQIEYDDGRDAWTCPDCGWVGPNAPAAPVPVHPADVTEAVGLPSFLVSADDAEKFFARKFEQAMGGVKVEDPMPDSTLITTLPGDARSPRGGDEEQYPPMLRRPMPDVKPVKDHPLQPYARFTTEDHEGSLWVAIMLPPETGAKIMSQYARGEPRDNGVGPHITLAYYGNKSKHPPDAFERIKKAVAEVVATHPPLEFTLTGSGKFAATKNSDGRVPVYVVPSAVGLSALRTDIVRAIAAAGIEYSSPFDFVPHICVGYVNEAEVQPPTIEPGLSWVTDFVTVMSNPEKAEFELGGPSPYAFKEDVDPDFDYLWTKWAGKDDQLGPEMSFDDWMKKRRQETAEATHFVKSVLDASK